MLTDPCNLDLVDEMQWEDHPSIIWLTLEEAGLEGQDYDTVPSSQWFGYYLDEDVTR
jgi:hypothetical protein